MKISTKGRYAVRMLSELAGRSPDEYVSLKELAQTQNISKKYLEQIVVALNKGGILNANRGLKGGYKLAKKPEECTVGEILRLTEGGLAPVACLESKPNGCSRCEECSTLFVWEGLMEVIENYLDKITLSDIIADKSKRL